MPTAAEEAAMGVAQAPAAAPAPATAGQGEAAAVVGAYFDAIAARDLDAMCACWEPGTLDILHGVAEMRAPEGIREWFANTFAAMPDFRLEVVDFLPVGDKVAVRWHMTGSFSGEARFEGAIATGAPVDITGCDVLTVRGGKIVENNAYMNGMQLARQLGLLPPQGSGQEKALIGATNLKTRLSRKRGR